MLGRCHLSPIVFPRIAWIAFVTALLAMAVHAQDQPFASTRSSVTPQPTVTGDSRPYFPTGHPRLYELRPTTTSTVLTRITLLEPTLQMAVTGFPVTRVSETPGIRQTFTTDFPLAEAPITQSGNWQHLGTSWTYVRSIAGRAVGTQTGSGGYDDSYAYLTGFGPDQTVQATLWMDSAIGDGGYREVELLLRWADTRASARGYECNLALNGSYAQIVRWNGRYGDFTYITNQTGFTAGIMPPRNGDILTATISDSVIHVYLNKNDGRGDQLIVTGVDTTYRNGNPGMGFFVEGRRADPTQFGFSSYTASSH
jgi:hypothetical protein